MIEKGLLILEYAAKGIVRRAYTFGLFYICLSISIFDPKLAIRFCQKEICKIDL